MKHFIRFALMMLQYRRVLIVAMIGLLIDTMCAVGGLATLQVLIEQLFSTTGNRSTLVDGTITLSGEAMRVQTEGGDDAGAAVDGAVTIAGPRIEIESERSVATVQQILREKLSHAGVRKWIGDQTWLADALPGDPFWGLVVVLVFIFVLAVIGSLGRYMHASAMITATLRTILRIRRMIFMRMVHLPMATVVTDGTADRISAIVRDVNGLRTGFNAVTNRGVRGMVMGLSMLLAALVMDWVIVAIFFIVVPPVVILIRKFGKVIRKATRRALRQYGVMLAALTETMHGLRVVKVHHTEGYERRRFNAITRRAYAQEMKSRVARAVSSPAIELVSMVGIMIVVMVAAWYIYESGREAADFAQVMIFLVMAAMNFKSLSGLNNDVQTAAASADRITKVLEQPVEPMARQEHRRDLPVAPRHAESIRFEGVSFTYPGADRPALRNIDFDVRFGTVCAVVGANGSGKTTLLGLLPRLYDPTAGRVLIDGVDIAGCRLRSVRRQVAMVTQETVLFEGTIAENITYGSRHVGEAALIDAARRAHAHDFITAMEHGYDSEVGERGQRLSGGQRQRIAIARAILREPAILILDEATSQIDADSEAQINAALAEIMRKRTTFVIAHRLSTVVNADQIVVLSDGMVASIGTHRELLEASDTYRVLCRTQLHGMAEQPG